MSTHHTKTAAIIAGLLAAFVFTSEANAILIVTNGDFESAGISVPADNDNMKQSDFSGDGWYAASDDFVLDPNGGPAGAGDAYGKYIKGSGLDRSIVNIITDNKATTGSVTMTADVFLGNTSTLAGLRVWGINDSDGGTGGIQWDGFMDLTGNSSGTNGPLRLLDPGDDPNLSASTYSGTFMKDLGPVYSLPAPDGTWQTIDFSFDLDTGYDQVAIEFAFDNGPDGVDNLAVAPAPPSATINTTIFNSVNNDIGAGEQAPGLATGITANSARLGTSDVEAAFGGTESVPGAATFLFEDLGAGTLSSLSPTNDRDNGTILFGDGTEHVDVIEWSTTSLVEFDGYAVNLGPDGNVTGANRASELVRFYVEDVLVDAFDANGVGGIVERLFDAGTLVGDDFRIEFTRTVNGGPRIVEIDAINAQVVPEPSTFALAALGLLRLVDFRRRRKR